MWALCIIMHFVCKQCIPHSLQGIAAYSWKLLSEHFVQPLLENADQAILHARNLLPGNYQFSLTVTDTSGQSSRTTVLVRVNKGTCMCC